jgi:hypothetical protein
MNTEIWGPKAWFFIHSLALGYPSSPTDKDKEHYRVFFNNLGYVLPCSWCRVHYHQNLNDKELERGLESRKDLFNFTVDIHNKVNSMLGKPILSHEDALNKTTRPYKNHRTVIFMVTLLIILLTLTIVAITLR